MHGECVKMTALRRDRPVRVAAPGREVVGADHRRAPLDLAEPADVVRRREIRDRPVLVVRCETGHAPHFAERALVQQEIDALAAGQLAARPLAHDSGVARPRRQPAVRQLLHGRHLTKLGSPGVLVTGRGSRDGRALVRRNHGNDLPRLDTIPHFERLERREDPSTGCRHQGSIFIALTTSSASPAATRSPSRTRTSETNPPWNS